MKDSRKFYSSQIIGTGSAFPERIMKNSEFESFVDTNDEWIRTRTGIEERRIADREKGETTASLSLEAAKRALGRADIHGEDLDLIVVGTVTPDTLMPTCANRLQAELGAKNAFSFDLQAACSGFIYGLSIADQYIRNGTIKTALVIGAETLSSVVNWKDRSTCVLFGDGAGAAILRRSEGDDHAVLTTKIFSDGTGGHLLEIPHGGSKITPRSPQYNPEMQTIQMQGSEIFKSAVRNMIEASMLALKERHMKVEDVDYFLFHQANIRIVDMCLKSMGISPKKTWMNLQKYGNTSAATLPVALDEAWRAGAVKTGDLVLMATFGGGLTWGSALVRL